MAVAVALDLFPNQILLVLGGALAASAAVLNLAQPVAPAQRVAPALGAGATRPADRSGR